MNPILLRASLYAIPLFLSPFAEKLGDILFKDQWPSPQQVVGCAIIGTIGMAIGLRAYFDGSSERLKNRKNENGSHVSEVKAEDSETKT